MSLEMLICIPNWTRKLIGLFVNNVNVTSSFCFQFQFSAPYGINCMLSANQHAESIVCILLLMSLKSTSISPELN